MLCNIDAFFELQDEKRSLDHNSVYSKDRSTTKDREGRADDPSAGVSNNNLKDIVSRFPQQQNSEEQILQPPRSVQLPSTALVPPKIHLSTEEDVKDISEDPICDQSDEIEKGNSIFLLSLNLVPKISKRYLSI